MLKLRTLSGLGDAVYAYPVVESLARKDEILLHTQYPEVYAPLVAAGRVQINPTREGRALAYGRSGKNNYESIAAQVGIEPPPFIVEFGRDEAADQIIQKIQRFHPGPICMIKEPCTAHMHRLTNDYSITPKVKTMQNWVDANPEYYFISCATVDNFKARLDGIDLRLMGLTVQTYLALCSMASCIATQIGHLSPIAQALGIDLKLFLPEDKGTAIFKNLTADAVLVKNARGSVEVIP